MEGDDNQERPALLIQDREELCYNTEEANFRQTSIVNKDTILIIQIRKAIKTNRFIRKLIEQVNNKKRIEYLNRILLFKELIYIL